MRHLRKFNEKNLFGIFRRDLEKFEFDIMDEYVMGRSERDYYNRIGNTIRDCLQDTLDEYQVDAAHGYKSLRYPIISYSLKFKDLMPKTELVSICDKIKLAIDQSSNLLDVKIKTTYPHVAYGPPNSIKCTYKIDKIFNRRRFTIYENFLLLERYQNVGPSSDIYFTILNPYYSEFNYGK